MWELLDNWKLTFFSAIVRDGEEKGFKITVLGNVLLCTGTVRTAYPMHSSQLCPGVWFAALVGRRIVVHYPVEGGS